MELAPVISFDPNIRLFMIKERDAYLKRVEKWIAASTITKISAEDLDFIYPKQDHEKALQKILAMGPRLAICTLGPKGALALLRRNDGTVTRVSAPVVDLPVMDTIGAGDTFHGAFLSWLEIKGKMSRSALANLSETDLYDALFFANKAASIVCSRRGAEPPTLREVQALKVPAAIGGVKAAAKKPVSPGLKGSSPAVQAPKVKESAKPQPKAAVKAAPMGKVSKTVAKTPTAKHAPNPKAPTKEKSGQKK
jgi:fructokinase